MEKVSIDELMSPTIKALRNREVPAISPRFTKKSLNWKSSTKRYWQYLAVIQKITEQWLNTILHGLEPI